MRKHVPTRISATKLHILIGGFCSNNVSNRQRYFYSICVGTTRFDNFEKKLSNLDGIAQMANWEKLNQRRHFVAEPGGEFIEPSRRSGEICQSVQTAGCGFKGDFPNPSRFASLTGSAFRNDGVDTASSCDA